MMLIHVNNLFEMCNCVKINDNCVYVRMYLELGKWDRVNAVKMVNLVVQVRRNRFPCGTNRFPLIKTEACEFWVAGNRFPDRDNPVPHSKNQRRDFGSSQEPVPMWDEPGSAAFF